LVGLFRSHDGTSDRAKDPTLKTRYYNLQKDKAWDEVSSTLKKIPGFKVLHEVESVGEITLEKKTAFGRTLDITVSVLNTTPVRCAVDMYSASRSPSTNPKFIILSVTFLSQEQKGITHFPHIPEIQKGTRSHIRGKRAPG